VSGPSFEQGEGRWLGAAEVYDAAGRYLGPGHDARAVRRDLDDGNVEVTVRFDGPFRLSGSYVISDCGDHRLYLGPLNHGYAEVLGDRLVDTNNYWPDIGLSQRLFLMVLPGGSTQLSLALLSRGEQAAYTVVGEYERHSPTDSPDVAGSAPVSPGVAGPASVSPVEPGVAPVSSPASDEPELGAEERSGALLERSGTWSGTLELLDDGGAPRGTAVYTERVERVLRPEEAGGAGGAGRLDMALAGSGFAGDATISLRTDGRQQWTGGASGGGSVVGSQSLWGGRALAGTLLFGRDRLRLWRREVARRDGSCKGVVHTWYRGGSRVGVAHGVLDFTPARR